MAHLSLIGRAEVIRLRFNLHKYSHTAVINLYRRHKISYRKPQYSYSRKEAQHKELILKQFEVSKQITEAM